MGYTHYWGNENNAEIDQSKWNQSIAEAQRLVAALANEYQLADVDVKNGIWFNGYCETFSMPQTCTEVAAFDFCKTNHGVYDDVVVACLCLLAESGLSVRSDGDYYDWAAGAKLASEFVGREVPVPESVIR